MHYGFNDSKSKHDYSNSLIFVVFIHHTFDFKLLENFYNYKLLFIFETIQDSYWYAFIIKYKAHKQYVTNSKIHMETVAVQSNWFEVYLSFKYKCFQWIYNLSRSSSKQLEAWRKISLSDIVVSQYIRWEKSMNNISYTSYPAHI